MKALRRPPLAPAAGGGGGQMPRHRLVPGLPLLIGLDGRGAHGYVAMQKELESAREALERRKRHAGPWLQSASRGSWGPRSQFPLHSWSLRTKLFTTNQPGLYGSVVGKSHACVA